MADGTLKVGTITTSSGSGNISVNANLEMASGKTQKNLLYPTFLATRSTNQSISNATHTKIEFDTEVFDEGGYYDNSTNYRFTPLVAGKYFFTVQAGFENLSGTGHRLVWSFKKNGSFYSIMGEFASNTDSSADPTWCGSATIEMNGTTDYVEAFIYQDTGGAKNIVANANHNKFSAFRIGD